MLLVEFNRRQSSLKEMLLGICLNSGKGKINKSAVEIVARDLKKFSPVRLWHCYDKDELRRIIEKLNSYDDSEFVVREVIPTSYSLGIIRDREFNPNNISTLTDEIYSRYRYYIFHKGMVNGKDVTSVVTYNPEVTDLSNSTVRLTEALRINCGVMQIGDVRELSRVLEVKQVIPEDEGLYIVYSIDDKIDDGMVM